MINLESMVCECASVRVELNFACKIIDLKECVSCTPLICRSHEEIGVSDTALLYVLKSLVVY